MDELADLVLHKDTPNSSWGFRMQGGVDFDCELMVQRVFIGSPSEGELHRGDVIVSVQGVAAANLKHHEADELIRRAGSTLSLRVRRFLNNKFQFNKFQFQFQFQLPSTGKPFVLQTDDKNKQIVHAQFNSPLNIYSTENVVDTIQGQTGYRPGAFVPSATMRAVYEDEAYTTGGALQVQEAEPYQSKSVKQLQSMYS
ncbi:PREDICTED: PDZ and LIM domain protein 3-like [Priapulus caudatus]|uniref:PDZ and LIM domain protein 3-like n=1 Tax=Priapulus caudatus TaxID=37621 RepID=A0ABM1F370_PRICU|nr:PREDICTED: PDZ and LIM domain protein 3-like [Priapulus caudatus]